MLINKEFYDAALKCIEAFKQSLYNKIDVVYKGTLYVSINKENRVHHSITPEVFSEDTVRAILIHHYRAVETTLWHSGYEVHTINPQLLSKWNWIDDRYKLIISKRKNIEDQWLSLTVKGISPDVIYECEWPMESNLQTVWDVYQGCLKCKTEAEARLLGQLAMANHKIHKLEKEVANTSYKEILLTAERDQYKSLLDEIKAMVDVLKK